MLDRDDSPWYPTMRLFRQPERDDWRSVFTAIERELRSLLDVQKDRAIMSAKPDVHLRNDRRGLPDLTGTFKQALAFHRTGRLADAENLYRQILETNPNHFDSLHLLGVVCGQRHKHGEAVRQIDAALKVNPNVASALNNRGLALEKLERLDEALASYDKAIALKPDFTEAFNNRGEALRKMKRLDEALASHDKAIALKPDYAEAFSNRGIALRELNRLDEALASYYKAIALKPDFAEAFNNRGKALLQLKRLDEALASYDQAIALKPDYAEGFQNRALCRLLAGQYEDGWKDYEWRWEAKDFPGKRPNINAPLWRGEELRGRRLLVFDEQGLGDVIQFVRYLPLLVERQATVTLLTTRKLFRLLRPLAKKMEVIGSTKDNDTYDFQCALMSLPLRFNTDLSSIPDQVPYLAAEEKLVARWKARIGEHGFKIGIAWQGNPKAPMDQGRSIPLAEFVPLSGLPGVRLISLQKHHGLDQIARLPASCKIETLGDDFDSGSDAFVDTAAAMESLDLIITSDTSIAHLAGALGRPTWLALRHVPDWRWMLDRDDSPWYPTMRLFRQPERDDWRSVFDAIGQELRSLLDVQKRRAILLDLTAAFKQALAFHRAGRFADAENLYRQILETHPNHFDSLHLLGVVYGQLDKHAEAVRQIDAALRINPNDAPAFNNRGNALLELKRWDEALASYDQAIALKPDYASAFNNRGIALLDLDRK